MRILYITRKYPPSIGGMQTQSYQLHKALSAKNSVSLISWGHSQIFLPLFVFFAFVDAIIKLNREKIDIIQLGDLVLSPLGLLLKLLFKKSTFTISHGRDSAYENFLYNFLVIRSAGRLDGIICVSHNIKQRLISRGLPAEKLEVIPNGIFTDSNNKLSTDREAVISEIEGHYGVQLKDSRILLSMSRLVPKKGIMEFIEGVFIKIKAETENIIYLIAGEGPERAKIQRAINKLGLKNNIHLLGSVKHSSNMHKALFKAAGVFVMPNAKVGNDAEGFGVAVLEAAIMGAPVVAYDVDGISTALHNNKNGILVESGNKDLFAEAVLSFLKDDARRLHFADNAREYVINNFNWNKIASAYLKQYSQPIK